MATMLKIKINKGMDGVGMGGLCESEGDQNKAAFWADLIP